MVRISKQSERRAKSPRKTRTSSFKKSENKKVQPVNGFKEHQNALDGQAAQQAFIPKIK